jgi:hypothetical protein
MDMGLIRFYLFFLGYHGNHFEHKQFYMNTILNHLLFLE